MRMPFSTAGGVLLAATLPLAAEESRELYVQAGTSPAAWEKLLAPLRAVEPQLEYTVVEVPAEANTPAAAKARAKAIEAGIAALPSLVLKDELGAYAALPLAGISVQKLDEARAKAKDPQRADTVYRRHFDARCYQLCARISQPELSNEALSNAIEECRLLLQHGKAEDADRQFLGLRCLYPLLMMQYARGYDGAHNPATEAKLLEAIAALEAARDINRETPLGKAAFAERERLRAARREARKYE